MTATPCGSTPGSISAAGRRKLVSISSALWQQAAVAANPQPSWTDAMIALREETPR